MGEGTGERGESMLVEIVDGIEDDGDRVVLGKLAFRQGAVKEISSGGKLKAEVVFCARLEAKPDLG